MWKTCAIVSLELKKRICGHCLEHLQIMDISAWNESLITDNELNSWTGNNRETAANGCITEAIEGFNLKRQFSSFVIASITINVLVLWGEYRFLIF